MGQTTETIMGWERVNNGSGLSESLPAETSSRPFVALCVGGKLNAFVLPKVSNQVDEYTLS